MRCIWCLQSDRKSSEEHIVPLALGCPDDWVLRREVCEPCNNGLGSLDRHLADEFDIFRVQAGVHARRGKKPRITSRSNLRGERRAGGYDFLVNMSARAVTHPHYGVLNPPSGKLNDAQADFLREGSIGQVTLRVLIGATPEFSRAIHKIGFAWLAKIVGPEITWRKYFDEVRAFVLHGVGTRHVLVLSAGDYAYQHRAGRVYSLTVGHWCVDFTISGLPFAVDLSPGQQVLPTLMSETTRAYGRGAWGILPPPRPGARFYELSDSGTR